MTVNLLPPPPAALDAAGGDELLASMSGPTVVIDAPAASGRTDCDVCPHGRRQHSRNGCTEVGCTCTRTYMDLCAG